MSPFCKPPTCHQSWLPQSPPNKRAHSGTSAKMLRSPCRHVLQGKKSFNTFNHLFGEQKFHQENSVLQLILLNPHPISGVPKRPPAQNFARTLAPTAFPSSTAMEPIPPPAPVTKSHSLGFKCPRVTKP